MLTTRYQIIDGHTGQIIGTRKTAHSAHKRVDVLDLAYGACRYHVQPVTTSTDPEPLIDRCAWFARCTNPATGTTSHPVLGSVPTCDRCHTFATGQSRG